MQDKLIEIDDDSRTTKLGTSIVENESIYQELVDICTTVDILERGVFYDDEEALEKVI